MIAEYLGAKWLALCFDEECSQRRILGLFGQGEGVPTSLRGLHAWMAHFSDALALHCIDADPYAVLRYGDAEALDVERARALLSALTKLSKANPYFRSEDWGRHPASGLMRTELKDEIHIIIGASERHMQLRTLLVEAMAGTALATELVQALDAIMLNPDRYYDERAGAANAIRVGGARDDWEAVILRLLSKADADSAQLACEILDDVGAGAVSIPTSVEVVFAHLGLTVSQFPRSDTEPLWNVRRSLFGDLDTGQLCMLLDEIAVRSQVLACLTDHSGSTELANLVSRLAAEVLEAEQAIEARRVWEWIGWLGQGSDYDDESRMRLAEIFRTDRALRAALLELVLLTPNGNDAFMAVHRLVDTQLDLYPTSEDLAGMLKVLRARAGDGAIDPDVWRRLLHLDRHGEGITAVVRDAATEAACGDPELLAALAEMSKVVVYSWQVEEAEHKAKGETKRQEFLRSRRAALAERVDDIAAGDFRVLAESAGVYLGKYRNFDRTASTETRLREFLGDNLCDQVLAGFVAVLGRDDLPSASEIAKVRCEGKMWPAELPMICGVAEMLRQGRKNRCSRS